ncbi:MBL fold metallo-hydrolase [Candidatus Pacearchaeota archaeon]|nr:MBL fold metallo-hydrolase [Candidatus Pacearchaeota archaeon]
MEWKGNTVRFLGHSGFLITSSSGKLIAIDPYNISSNLFKADIILITHSHYDHCSIKDIEKISKSGTKIIVPADAQSKVNKIKDVEMEIVESGDEIKLANLKICAVPAYNIGKKFHPKSEGWLGYIIDLDGVVFYHAGDSDMIPEMKNLTGYGKRDNDFIVLLPVSGEYVMNYEEAAEVASLLSPDFAIPMHYGAGVVGTIEDAEKFVELCRDKGIEAGILEKI